MVFEITCVDIPVLLLYNLDPSWSMQDQHECHAVVDSFASALNKAGHAVHNVCIRSDDLETVLEKFDPELFLIFNWCEELPGIPRSEDEVAQILERLGFTFTGASSNTLALCQNKPYVKQLLLANLITTPEWQVISSLSDIPWSKFPAIVKLPFEHCSYGISRESVVQSMPELIQRVRYVLNEMHQPALVEEFIDGREFHVGVVGNDSLKVLPPAEIDYSSFPDIHDRLCTYESNFDPTSLAYQLTLPKVPAELTMEQINDLKGMIISAYRLLKCRDYARMDIRMRNGIFYLLDVNPNPDISPDTSLVLGGGLIGLSYGELGSLFLHLAAQRLPKFASEKERIK